MTASGCGHANRDSVGYSDSYCHRCRHTYSCSKHRKEGYKGYKG